jgi:hypothetical protein
MSIIECDDVYELFQKIREMVKIGDLLAKNAASFCQIGSIPENVNVDTFVKKFKELHKQWSLIRSSAGTASKE